MDESRKELKKDENADADASAAANQANSSPQQKQEEVNLSLTQPVQQSCSMFRPEGGGEEREEERIKDERGASHSSGGSGEAGAGL